MRRLYSLIALLVMATITSFASITINASTGGVAIASYYDSTAGSYNTLTLEEGANVINSTSSINFQISDNSYIFTNFVKDGTACTGFGATYYYMSVTDGITIDVTTKTLTEAYDAKCHVKIDTPSQVMIRMNSTNRTPSLSTEFDLSFVSSLESPIYVSSTTNGVLLYKIILNGVEQTVSTSNYITIKDGDNLEIMASYPDITCNIKFTYADGAEGFITGVTVNNETVSDFNSGFTAKAGSTVYFTGNTSEYAYEQITVNGTALNYFYGSSSFVVSADTEIYVKAHKYGNITVNVNVTDPSHITFYNGGTVMSLVAGDNALSFAETNTSVTIRINDGYYFKSVKVDDVEKYSSGSSYVYLSSTTANSNIVIETGKINRDKNFVFYVNDKSLAQYGFSVSRADRSTINVENGYNVVPFYSADYPIYLAAYGPESIKVYQNGTEVSPVYTGGTSFTVSTLADNDVLKVFLNTEPEKYYVSVITTLNEDDVVVTKDMIVPVNNYASFSVLGPSQIDITVNGDAAVLVNDVAIEPVDGKYTFTADQNTSVSVTERTAVDAISVDNASTYDVYNLQGIRVARGVNSTNNLPAGIYIANGKKVMVK